MNDANANHHDREMHGGEAKSARNTLMKKVTAMALIAVAIFMGGLSKANAWISGWNLVVPTNCVGYAINGIDYLTIYSSSGSITTADPLSINAAAQYCANGTAFYLYTTNGVTVVAVSIYPGLK
jgi:hypothetical protein